METSGQALIKALAILIVFVGILQLWRIITGSTVSITDALLGATCITSGFFIWILLMLERLVRTQLEIIETLRKIGALLARQQRREG